MDVDDEEAEKEEEEEEEEEQCDAKDGNEERHEDNELKPKLLRKRRVFVYVMHAKKVMVLISSKSDMFTPQTVGERNACAYIVKQ